MTEQEEQSKEFSTEFVSDLREFIDLCEQISTAKDEMKLLNERKNELETKISDFMFDKKIPAFATPIGKVSIHQRKSVKPLNKDYLSEMISEKVEDRAVVDEIVNKTFGQRPITFIQKIRVVKNRK